MINEYDLHPGTFTISVGYADILNGKRGNASCCAVALAVRRVLDVQDVEVESDTFRVGSLEGFFKPSIENFIASFDEGREGLEPFTCELKLEWRERE